jgi:hypothetical protein
MISVDLFCPYFSKDIAVAMGYIQYLEGTAVSRY